MSDDRLMDKINALLAKAEGTKNDHERETYFAKAQQLMTLYQIDAETLRRSRGGRDRSVSCRRIYIGEPRQVGLSTLAELFMAIGWTNGLRFTVAHDSTHLNAFGFDEDIDMTEALYNPLAMQMIASSVAYMKTGQHRFEGIHGKTARINFQCAFVGRIGDRLEQARDEAIREYEPGDPDGSPGKYGELVLAARRDDVSRFFEENKGHVRGSYRGSQPSDYSVSAWLAGEQAGDRAHLGIEPTLNEARLEALSA